MNVNKAIVLGNLTRDPEVKTITSGQTVSSFSVATNRFWKNKETGNKEQQTEFHNIIAWGRLAEIAEQFLKKGGLVYIEGRLQTRTWEDKDSKKKMYKTEIVAEKIQLGPRNDNQGSQVSQKSKDNTPEEEINVEEIPF